ncbi:hypothetical protein IV203_025672 [Nitzschia inconspicua]|uniref:Sulfotransferase n=1 Tax=Nitzschia inconspicua TaxID=303405 RepID=A0A9K3PWI5_9STRA|nr:hypothetical protein IV203_025672 [Nitzschia inconspicua]
MTGSMSMKGSSFFQFLLLAAIVIVGNYWNFVGSIGNDVANKVTSKEYPRDATVQSTTNTTTTIAANRQDAPFIDYGNSNWCPNSICNNSPLCYPCKRRFLIIFASGRSASTTLNWMLDSLPGVRMSGENNGLLWTQFHFFQNTFCERNFIEGTNLKAAFGRNKIPNGALSCILQNSIEIITPPKLPIASIEKEESTIIGFKTIRAHTAKNRNEMEAFVKFLKEHLPCTRYLINYRSDTVAHLKSLKEAFKWEGNNVKTKVERENQNLKLMYELLGPDLSYMLDSSEWTKDVRILNKALDWLGFGQGCHFPSLLEFNTMKYKHTKQMFKHPSIFANCTRL